MTGTRWLYRFSEPLPAEGDAVDWCGNKGASLRGLHAAGLPVPAGFTIITEACRQYLALNRRFPDGLSEQLNAAVSDLERETGRAYAWRRSRCCWPSAAGRGFPCPACCSRCSIAG